MPYGCKFIHILVLLCLASSFCLFFQCVEGMNRQQHQALPKLCSAELQACGLAARGYGQAGRLSHSQFRAPLSQDRRLEIRNFPFPAHPWEMRENPPTPLGSFFGTTNPVAPWGGLQFPECSALQREETGQDGGRRAGRVGGRVGAGAGGGGGGDTELQGLGEAGPEPLLAPVLAARSRGAASCSPRADEAGGAPGADTCGAPRAAVAEPGRSCGRSVAAPLGLALMLPSPLRSRPPLYSSCLNLTWCFLCSVFVGHPWRDSCVWGGRSLYKLG